MTRITETYRDHTATARREHVHGRLLPMERPEGEPSLFSGAALLVAIALLALLAIVILSPASGANPASSSIASRPIEAGAAGVGEG